MTFKSTYNRLNWLDLKTQIYTSTTQDVECALLTSEPTTKNFAALISPAASPYLEQMAQKSRAITKKRFGNTIQMYAPLYLSNECQNICTYCGFSLDNKIKRKTLTPDEILQEVEVLKQMSYDHVLLLTGEANRTVGFDYILHAVELVRPYFSNISIEVQPLKESEYKQLKEAGVYAVLIYQETYHKESYKEYHPKGKKSNFFYRLNTADRVGKAGMHKIGIGALLGLDDWRVDSLMAAHHLEYLEKRYWQSKFAISFPRLRPFSGGVVPKSEMSDRDLTQLICAWRIFNENVELSLSTRESESFRDNIIQLGITSTSAGSKTNPGGYASGEESLEQFEISDERSPEEVTKAIKSKGLEVVWKDWDKMLI